MKLAARALALCLALALSSRVFALDYEFKAPADVTDPAADAAMRDLAGRILPVYHEDDQERYLSNLSALQLVAGTYAAAHGTRVALRERRQETHDTRTDSRELLLDLYAQARMIEADEQVTFGQAFDRAFTEPVSKLSDTDAYDITGWPGPQPGALQDALQQALERVRGREQIDQVEALRLIWTYLAFDLWRSAGAGLEALAAEDDPRRFIIENDVPIKTVNRSTLYATVIRPKNATGRLPALLELANPARANEAKASAAHGYVGVIAYERGRQSKHDGENAPTAIAWIARQKWSDGRVAMFGHDDGASDAWSAAMRRPRALKAIVTKDAVAPGGGKRVPSGKAFAAVTIPVLATTGDCGSSGTSTLQYFRQHTHYNKRADHRLLLDACDAGASLYPSTVAVIDLRALRYQWLDHVFKAAPIPPVLQGRVNYEAANEWRHADSLQDMTEARR